MSMLCIVFSFETLRRHKRRSSKIALDFIRDDASCSLYQIILCCAWYMAYEPRTLHSWEIFQVYLAKKKQPIFCHKAWTVFSCTRVWNSMPCKQQEKRRCCYKNVFSPYVNQSFDKIIKLECLSFFYFSRENVQYMKNCLFWSKT